MNFNNGPRVVSVDSDEHLEELYNKEDVAIYIRFDTKYMFDLISKDEIGYLMFGENGMTSMDIPVPASTKQILTNNDNGYTTFVVKKGIVKNAKRRK